MAGADHEPSVPPTRPLSPAPRLDVIGAAIAAGSAVALTLVSWRAAVLVALAPAVLWLIRRRWEWLVWPLSLEMILGGWGHAVMLGPLPARHALLALVLGAWLLNKIADRSWTLEGGPFAWATIGLLVFVSIAILVSLAKGNPDAIQDGMTVSFLLLVFPFSEIAGRPGGARWLLRCFLLSVFALAVIQVALTAAILLGVIDANWLGVVFQDRLGGISHIAGSFWRVFIVGSIYFQVVIVILVAAWLGDSTILGPVLDRVTLVAATIGLLLTYTRAFWLATIVGLCVVMVLTTPLGRLRVLAGVLVAIPATLFLMHLAELSFVDVFVRRIARLFDPDRDISVAVRLSLYPRLWARIIDRPLLGYGYGLLVENQLYYENSYFYYLIKCGIVGLAVVAWSWISPLVVATRMARSKPHSRGRAIGTGLVAALVSMLLVTAINPFINSAVGLYFQALTCAVLYGWLRADSEDWWTGHLDGVSNDSDPA